MPWDWSTLALRTAPRTNDAMLEPVPAGFARSPVSAAVKLTDPDGVEVYRFAGLVPAVLETGFQRVIAVGLVTISCRFQLSEPRFPTTP
jgi:hypothetical protein